MQIIGFAGLARAGKTTAAKHVGELAFDAGYHVVLDHFAGPLKRAAEAVGAHKGGETDALYRLFCQTTGKMMRDPATTTGITGPDYWVGQMEGRLKAAFEHEGARLGADLNDEKFHETLVLIDDVRYQNEVDLIRSRGGKVVFVAAGQRLDDLEAEWRQHESERLAFDYMHSRIPDDTFDFILPNNRDESELLLGADRGWREWAQGEICD